MKQKISDGKNYAEPRRNSTASPGARSENKEILSGQFIPYINERNHMGRLIQEVSPIEQSFDKKKPRKNPNIIESTA